MQQYDKGSFWVRRPDGSIGSRDQVFGTMSNDQAVDRLFCQSDNCGVHVLPPIELLPSPGNRYYFDLFTMDQKHKGKSETFVWE